VFLVKNPFLYSKILVVDDEEEVCSALNEFLKSEEFIVEVAHDGEDALEKVESFKPHCVLLDIKMPYLNGVEALKMIKLRSSNTEVIMVTALSNIKMAEECMRDGAYGYIAKPVDLDYLLKEIRSALEHRKATLAESKKEASEKKEKTELELMNQLLNTELFHGLQFTQDMVQYLAPEFAGHSKNVAWLSEKIAKKLGLEHSRLCYLAGLYHDIGKLSFPKMLNTRSSEDWTQSEREVYKKYPSYGQEFLQSHFRLRGLGTIIRHQSENVDGTGYPDGLDGDEIPIESKVVAVANGFCEEMQSVNLKRIEWDIGRGDKCLKAIKKNVRKKYDSLIVDALGSLVEDYKNKTPKEKRVPLANLQAKMVLSRDIYTHTGKFIFSRDQALTKFSIQKLYDIHKIDPVEDPLHISNG
jgi:putative nucleotidyltransferase with HDIG domain